MIKMVKVSIITPCLNSERTIRDTIESVLKQTYSPMEYIIIDGGSTDRTLDIIEEYRPRFGGRMRYVSEKDKGIYNAMNKGIKMSRGNLIGIINSDDYYETDSIEKVVSCMSDDDCQVVYGCCRMIEKAGTVRCRYVKHTSLPEKMIVHPACFVTRKTYQKYGLFIENFHIAADYELMLRLYVKEDVKFYLCPCVLANFRQGGVSCTNMARTKMEHEMSRLMHGYGSLKEFLDAYVAYCLLR